MNEKEFRDWMALHISVTGAEPERLSELLAANRATICVTWKATYAEMCEASDRLVEQGKVPDWPNEHANALKRELDAIRDKTRVVKAMEFQRAIHGHEAGCDCPGCNGGKHLPAWDAARKAARKRLCNDPKRKR